jgi:uncharacterized protein
MIGGVRRLRDAPVTLPDEVSSHRGLAFSLWRAERELRGAVVIIPGAGSVKESHHDFARVAAAQGLAALVFDARGHGASPGPLDGRVFEDVATMADLLRDRVGAETPIALRGSSMGGYIAITAAATAGAGAVVAICPASAEGLRRGLATGAFDFAADVSALDAVLSEHDAAGALDGLDIPVLIMHAEGDERVPVQTSIALKDHLRHPRSRLLVIPGGHHRSVQHDEEFQAVSAQFLAKALARSAR